MTSTQRILRDLKHAYPQAEITFAGSGHIRLRFPGGQLVFVSASPSGPYFMAQVRRTVRRTLKKRKTT